MEQHSAILYTKKTTEYGMSLKTQKQQSDKIMGKKKKIG